jgi:hypothetical protein
VGGWSGEEEAFSETLEGGADTPPPLAHRPTSPRRSHMRRTCAWTSATLVLDAIFLRCVADFIISDAVGSGIAPAYGLIRGVDVSIGVKGCAVDLSCPQGEVSGLNRRQKAALKPNIVVGRQKLSSCLARLSRSKHARWLWIQMCAEIVRSIEQQWVLLGVPTETTFAPQGKKGARHDPNVRRERAQQQLEVARAKRWVSDQERASATVSPIAAVQFVERLVTRSP